MIAIPSYFSSTRETSESTKQETSVSSQTTTPVNTSTTTAKPIPAPESKEPVYWLNWSNQNVYNNLNDIIVNCPISEVSTPVSTSISGSCTYNGYKISVNGEFSSREVPRAYFTLKQGEYTTEYPNGFVTITVEE